MFCQYIGRAMRNESASICEQRRPRSACASAQSDKDIHCPLAVSLDTIITKTYLYNSDPLKPHLYIVKLGFTGIYIIFLISAQKHRLWVLVSTHILCFEQTSTHNLCFEQKYEKYQYFHRKIFIFWWLYFQYI